MILHFALLRNHGLEQTGLADYAAALREAVEFFDAHRYLPGPDAARILTLYYPAPAEGRLLMAIKAVRLDATFCDTHKDRADTPRVNKNKHALHGIDSCSPVRMALLRIAGQ